MIYTVYLQWLTKNSGAGIAFLNPTVLLVSCVLSVVGAITLHVGLDIGITMRDDMNVNRYARLLHNLHKVESLLT